MECSEKPIWNRDYTKEELEKLTVHAPDPEIYQKVLTCWDHVAKPIDGMGRFETLTAQIGAIQGTDRIDISKKAVIIMCADNGIVEEGISQSGQEVTAAVAKNMGNQRSSVGKMAEAIGADTIPVDIGIRQKEKIPGVLSQKVRCGTRNFRKEPAMTEEEVLAAIFTGVEMVSACKGQGYRILATGEMGIGNTTTSSAVAAALLGCEASEVTGRGAGLNDEKLLHKQQIIAEAIERYALKGADAFEILRTVGGLDIAGLTGVCIGGALFHVPIVLDGVISMAAALLAERLVPGTRAYLLPSHKGKEPAAEKLAAELGLEPVIDGRMALGEGTGAVMMLALLEMALSVYQDSSTFLDIQVEQYERFTAR
ncbi:MAG: nicotinate-nucleotide--dimethylbenzimidazole phosphoribosyltransferase [Lachnospiraceae bacterium]|nr:nicotinate-nucleotide--dimethylbenzimidazole phosphoribosyltransferase [Lachnospiraceae bacterium]